MSSLSGPPVTEAAKLFNNASAEYERRLGDTTPRVARFMLSLPPTPNADAIVLDNACGTGALTFELLKLLPSQDEPASRSPKVYAVDVAPAMVAMARQKAEATQCLIETEVMDAQQLTFPDNIFTHSYMNFGIFFLSDCERGAAEIYRTLQSGGTAFVSSWEDLGYLDIARAAQKTVRPHDAQSLAPMFSLEWLTEKKLRQTMIDGGFAPANVKILRQKTALRSDNLDGLVDTCLVSFANTMQEWSEEERTQMKDAVKSCMTEDQKRELSIDMHALVAVVQK